MGGEGREGGLAAKSRVQGRAVGGLPRVVFKGGRWVGYLESCSREGDRWVGYLVVFKRGWFRFRMVVNGSGDDSSDHSKNGGRIQCQITVEGVRPAHYIHSGRGIDTNLTPLLFSI